MALGRFSTANPPMDGSLSSYCMGWTKTHEEAKSFQIDMDPRALQFFNGST